jgi:hypothetical protein
MKNNQWGHPILVLSGLTLSISCGAKRRRLDAVVSLHHPRGA